jgi:membrane peptidoglycan carboxypeptidase
MQLIKTTREKTVSRKLEEILLVYILENNRIVSKNECLKFILILLNGDPMYME